MSEASARELVVVMTKGIDHELSSVAFTIANGGRARGYTNEDFIEGVNIAGSSVMHARLLAGAATLSF